jgi:4'-phosphopantetheinyl transferase
VELRVARSAKVLSQLPRDLTALEQERAAAFHSAADADDFVAAHLLARACVTAVTGASDVVLAQRCPTCGGPHGEPAVTGDPGVHVAWSHSHGWVAAVAARESVGIDLETRGRRHDVRRLAARTGTAVEAAAIGADEVAYLRMWTRKESLVKVGVLTLAGFGHADVSGELCRGFALSSCDTTDYVLSVAVQA